MTVREENKIIRTLFEDHGIKHVSYYNDAWVKTRRRVFKTNYSHLALMGNILDLLEERGIQGWERFVVHVSPNSYSGRRSGIKKVTNL